MDVEKRESAYIAESWHTHYIETPAVRRILMEIGLSVAGLACHLAMAIWR
jgi:hypothetical protein